MMAIARKKELEKELRKIEAEEANVARDKQKQKNWDAFLRRPADWIIGKAHAEQAKDNGWHHPKGRQLPMSVHIRGNMGHTYYPTASLTEASNLYFHNVWQGADRKEFERKLNDLVQSEVERIAKSLRSTLEIMGLQSNSHLLRELPENKVEEAERMIWEETKIVLDGFPDDDFRALPRKWHGIDENGDPASGARLDLSHSRGIMLRYLEENRPELHKEIKELLA